jgi:hypothetical protein
MGYQQRPNSGSLFVVEDRKEDDDPTSSGKIDIEGREYYIDAWILRDPGRDYLKDKMDLRFKAKGSSRKSGDGEGEMTRCDKKGKSENYPDWKGSLKMAESCREFEISGWRRYAKTDVKKEKPFLSLSVKPKQERQQEQRTQQAEPPRQEVKKSNDAYF